MNVGQRAKWVAKRVLPGFAQRGIAAFRGKVNWELWIRRVRRAFQMAPTQPAWLDASMLEQLQQQYCHPPKYRYDPAALEARGHERAAELLSLEKDRHASFHAFLELAAWDGMVGYALERLGKRATCIDNRSVGFDERALGARVSLLQMDAAHLGFSDRSFDFVFSYDAMEHFADPDLVLQEAIRVVRPGGYIYLKFGPLYDSPTGLHAYDAITVPYCQFLFPMDVLQGFCHARRLKAIDTAQLNSWPLHAYQALWKRYDHRLRRLRYREVRVYSDLDLIERYPSCFRSKTSSFASLTTGSIEVLFVRL